MYRVGGLWAQHVQGWGVRGAAHAGTPCSSPCYEGEGEDMGAEGRGQGIREDRTTAGYRGIQEDLMIQGDTGGPQDTGGYRGHGEGDTGGPHKWSGEHRAGAGGKWHEGRW